MARLNHDKAGRKFLTLFQRDFSLPAPGIALMHGRASVKVETAKRGLDSPIGYLAVWRHENGHWRFLAWQACRIVAPKP